MAIVSSLGLMDRTASLIPAHFHKWVRVVIAGLSLVTPNDELRKFVSLPVWQFKRSARTFESLHRVPMEFMIELIQQTD
jgi:hypothetical protein